MPKVYDDKWWVAQAEKMGYGSDDQMFDTLYWQQEMSMGDIGRILGISEITVRKRMTELGIRVRTRSEVVAIMRTKSRFWTGKDRIHGNK